MSSIPKPDKKPKYNKNDAFVWVDSQWEKFMTEQKELKTQVQEMIQEVEEFKSTIWDLVKQYPNNMELGGAIRELYWKNQDTGETDE